MSTMPYPGKDGDNSGDDSGNGRDSGDKTTSNNDIVTVSNIVSDLIGSSGYIANNGSDGDTNLTDN